MYTHVTVARRRERACIFFYYQRHLPQSSVCQANLNYNLFIYYSRIYPRRYRLLNNKYILRKQKSGSAIINRDVMEYKIKFFLRCVFVSARVLINFKNEIYGLRMNKFQKL